MENAGKLLQFSNRATIESIEESSIFTLLTGGDNPGDTMQVEATQGNQVIWRIMEILAGSSIPGFVWLAKGYINLASRVRVLETKSEIHERLHEQNARHNEEISKKLEILPAIQRSLDHLAEVCSKIVPREEYERQQHNLEERLKEMRRD